MEKRVIKFRAWGTKDECFAPLEDDGDYYFRDDGDGLCLYNKWGECKNIVLQQFTGLRDKNGKEIFEGDVVIDGDKRRVVKFSRLNASFYLSHENAKVSFYKEFIECGLSQSDGPVKCDTIEIIGNIYENPDLLTTKS